MSSEPVTVDVEDVARRVVANPRRARVSMHEYVGICAWIVRQIEAQDAPAMPASLAATIATVVRQSDLLQATPAGPDRAAQLLVLEASLNLMKTAFEKEFPYA